MSPPSLLFSQSWRQRCWYPSPSCPLCAAQPSRVTLHIHTSFVLVLPSPHSDAHDSLPFPPFPCSLGVSVEVAKGSGQKPAKLDLFHNKWVLRGRGHGGFGTHSVDVAKGSGQEPAKLTLHMHICTFDCSHMHMGSIKGANVHVTHARPHAHATIHPCTHVPMHHHTPMRPCTHAPMHPRAHAPMRPCTHASRPPHSVGLLYSPNDSAPFNSPTTTCPHFPTFLIQFPPPPLPPVPLRWRTAARMIRAGYNVLLMDTDVLLLNDPYEFWKKPPFSKFQILAQVRVEGGTEVGVYRLSNR